MAEMEGEEGGCGGALEGCGEDSDFSLGGGCGGRVRGWDADLAPLRTLTIGAVIGGGGGNAARSVH